MRPGRKPPGIELRRERPDLLEALAADLAIETEARDMLKQLGHRPQCPPLER
jgi:hypothetical protein